MVIAAGMEPGSRGTRRRFARRVIAPGAIHSSPPKSVIASVDETISANSGNVFAIAKL
jgi:hypothetical protein